MLLQIVTFRLSRVCAFACVLGWDGLGALAVEIWTGSGLAVDGGGFVSVFVTVV